MGHLVEVVTQGGGSVFSVGEAMRLRDPYPEFEAFVAEAEPRLRRALTASFGQNDGRDATLDALSWGWEHWDRLRRIKNPIGYLYRVDSTAAVRGRPTSRGQGAPVQLEEPVGFEPGLIPALVSLTDQQRSAVVLVHGYGYTFREAAEVLGTSLSTLRNHVRRAMFRLRSELEVDHEYID